MPLSGEAIRTMNYVDDISVTLRRILAVLPSLTEEERQRVSEHIKHSEPSYESVITAVASKSNAASDSPSPFQIRTVAVIGAGTAGRSFALSCVAAGYHVVLEDVMPANLRRAEADFAEMDLRDSPGSLDLASTVEDAVREADIAVDFVPDELESKLEIFSMVDRMAPPKTILCTPSDALSITDLASCVYRPERCFAVRGGFTAGVTGVGSAVRLLYPASADGGALAAAGTFLRSLRIKVQDEPDPDAPVLMKNQTQASL